MGPPRPETLAGPGWIAPHEAAKPGTGGILLKTHQPTPEDDELTRHGEAYFHCVDFAANIEVNRFNRW
jgi:hypothetical protein